MIDKGVLETLRILFDHIDLDSNHTLIRDIAHSEFFNENGKMKLDYKDIQQIREYGMDINISRNLIGDGFKLSLYDNRSLVDIADIDKNDFIV
jgi:hypothetical protein